MICKKCGTDTDISFGVCPVCGTILEETVSQPTPQNEPQYTPKEESQYATQYIPSQEENTPEAETVGDFNSGFAPFEPMQSDLQPKPKKKKKKWLIILLAVVGVLLAAGAIIFFCFRSNVEETIAKLSSPEDHQLYAYSRLADNLTENYGTFISSAQQSEIGTEGSISLTVSETAKALLYGSDIAALESLDIKYNVNSKDNVCAVDLGLFANGNEIVKGELVIDMNSKKMTLNLPDLSNRALEIDMAETGLYSEEMLSATDIMPEHELVAQLLPRYVDKALVALSGVEREESQLTINGISQSATCLTTKITDKVAYDVAIAVLNEAKNDQELKTYIIETVEKANKAYGGNDDPNEAYEEFLDSIDDAIEEINGEEITNELIITIKTWVDSSCDIIALDIYDDEDALFIGCVENGGNIEAEFSAKHIDESMFVLSVSGKEEKGLFNGSMLLTAENEEILVIKIENYNTESEKFEGKLSITSAAFNDLMPGMGMMNFTVEGKMNDGKEELVLAMGAGDAKLITLTFASQTHAPIKAELHTDTMDDAEDWMLGIDLYKITKALSDSGLDTIIAGLTEDYFYGDSNDYYDDEYYDDKFYFDGETEWNDEYDEGYWAGYSDGFSDGLDEDYCGSYDYSASSHSEDYYDGYDDGYEDGYDDGCDENYI